MSSNTTRKATRSRGVCLRAEEVRTLRDTGAVVVRRPAPVPECDVPGAYFDAYNGGPVWCWWTPDGRPCNGHGMLRCPLGAPGDPLWAREAWHHDDAWYPGTTWKNTYVEGEGWTWVDFAADATPESELDRDFAWRSAATMPFWASRFPDLRVASVAVERATDGEAWEWVVRIEKQGRGEGA